ncbi:MAG TPA: ATP-grasp domain-containing protein [Streptosporangiaceae bacterium]|nr:ATP-grasp domain-containing protein [Streptosporangiaceae bacterium]
MRACQGANANSSRAGAGARRLLLVGLGSLGRPYLTSAHRRGLTCAIADLPGNMERARGMLRSGDAWYPVPESSAECWYSAAASALADGPVDAVIGFGDPQVRTAALIAAEFGLPGPGLLAASISRNKLLSRELFARKNVRQPQFAFVRDAHEAVEWAAGHYPVVLKPLSGQGSAGVRIAMAAEEVQQWAGEETSPDRFLVERYLPGPEFSCEAVVAEGRVLFANVTEKTTTRPPYCVELAHHIPVLDAAVVQAAESLTREVVAGIGMTAGIIHAELKSEPDGAYLVEFAVRMPGDRVMELIRLATGVDLFDAVVDIALGERPEVTRSRSDAACVWYPYVTPGQVTAVDGLPELSTLPGVLDHHIKIQVGSEVRLLRSSAERVGWVILTGADRAELAHRLDAVRDTLAVTVAAPGVTPPARDLTLSGHGLPAGGR